MTSISLKNVTLDIPIFDARKSLRSKMFSTFTGGRISVNRKSVMVKALDNVSIDLNPGDRLGLVGHNGSGKSTLLRVMAGIYEPLVGEVFVNGRVISLFNNSLGLDIDKTGRDNIKNIAYLLGMSRAEIQKNLSEIVEFCELGDFIDLPARTYSAGMLVRLGFGVATSMHPEILLLDEGIGVGDARFATRAKARLDSFYERAKTLVIASHSDELIRSLCNKAALMEKGKLIMLADVDSVLERYHAK